MPAREADPQLATALPAPRSPSIRREHSVAAGAGSAVLAHFFPKEAQRFTEAAEEASRSRVLAGVVYPSDARAGLELGRAVAARVIAYLKLDGQSGRGRYRLAPASGRGKEPSGIEEVTVEAFRAGPGESVPAGRGRPRIPERRRDRRGEKL